MNALKTLKNRNLLTLNDVTDEEFVALLDLAARLKAEKRAGRNGERLHRKNVALIFEKASTRTRCAASVAAVDEGGHAEYLGAKEVHLGKKESVADTARVLGRMFHGILFRGYEHRTVELLAEHAGVPVWNGLTDTAHPTQALADLLTVKETFGELAGLKLAYVGDGRNNVANSLMLACAKTGVHFVNGTPEALSPDPHLVARASEIASERGSCVDVVRDPWEAVQGANVVCTDVWASMGEESQMDERIRLLSPYQVNAALMEATGGVKNSEAIFLHCLPAFHDDQTELTRTSGALEVTDDVFHASYSRVFDEAENRVHTMKAVFVACLGGVNDAS